ncbi:hypothetical protein FGG08_006744 [Glutinoglossum americanum]|uniref:Heterokaryon incompatibility domain-containing protein n=1 Tax=Glutinoglossum americanum TaxID=1670608 RepID=A0A9P8KX60_9PEZI|nr:hypothetical protein FGG08_006744 [Glutinoglossum americanum]
MSETIGDQVELFLGSTASEVGQAANRASFNRSRWLEILKSPSKLAEFLPRLSTTQLGSHQLLQGWLLLRLEDEYFDSEAKVAQELVGLQPEAPNSRQSYHYHLANLLKQEFSQPAQDLPSDLYLAILHQSRRDAALYAASYRLACSCYKAALRPTLPQGLTNSPQPLRPRYGASIDPCPWLERKPQEGDLPFYLWDVKGKRTREVSEIIKSTGKVPDYVAISHTWGRWRKDDEPWVSLDVPWKIPQNGRFEVVDLPHTLERFPCKYIWLDLLTIPQEDSPPSMLEIQQAEIKRQATIFRNASTTVAWLNDVSTWVGLPAVIRYLCFNFLKGSVPDDEDKSELDSLLDAASTAAGGFTELFQTHEREGVNPELRQPNPWFTSLWTLQETCLRPDMWLCDATWNFVAASEEMPVALNDLIALVLVNHPTISSSTAVPKGARELARLFRITGLIGLLQLSRHSIITMGNGRHCTSRRAEAIMSAVGATEWFGTASDSLEEDLVLELYPLAFVNEVREKLGSASFFSSTPLGWEFHYVLRRFCSDKRKIPYGFEALGSLLPFGPGAHNIAFDTESNPHMAEHPSLDSWTVEDTGCVRILQAGIVSSSIEGPLVGDIRCILVAPLADNDENRLVVQKNEDLHSWIKRYKPDMPNFAVCLLHSPLASRGIILKEIAPGFLLKIGSYWQMERPGYEGPKTQMVNWLVV